MSEYVTVDELKTYKGLDLAEDGDDARLWRAVKSASSAFDRWTFRSYQPAVATRRYDHPAGSVLKLGGDLLACSAITTQNGAVTIESDEYLLKCGDRYDVQPYDRIDLRRDKGVLWSFAGTPQAATQVAGVWGYHRDYAAAWESTGDTVQDAQGLTASQATILVVDAGGLDRWGYLARFQQGQLLKIDDEFLYLRALDAGTDTLTVYRAANGSTAAAHAAGAPIYVWRTWPDVFEAVQELAAYLYDLKDSQVYDVTATPETGMMTIPKGIPAQVRLAVHAYRRHEL